MNRSRCFGRVYCLHFQDLRLLDIEDISTPLLRRVCTLLIYQLTRRNVSENPQLLIFVYLPITFTRSSSYLGAPDIFMARNAVNSRKLCLCLRQNTSFSLYIAIGSPLCTKTNCLLQDSYRNTKHTVWQKTEPFSVNPINLPWGSEVLRVILKQWFPECPHRIQRNLRPVPRGCVDTF
jgi:hypothetical protein